MSPFKRALAGLLNYDSYFDLKTRSKTVLLGIELLETRALPSTTVPSTVVVARVVPHSQNYYDEVVRIDTSTGTETPLYSHNDGVYASSDASALVAANGDVVFAFAPPQGGTGTAPVQKLSSTNVLSTIATLPAGTLKVELATNASGLLAEARDRYDSTTGLHYGEIVTLDGQGNETPLYSHTTGLYGAGDSGLAVAGNGDVVFAFAPQGFGNGAQLLQYSAKSKSVGVIGALPSGTGRIDLAVTAGGQVVEGRIRYDSASQQYSDAVVQLDALGNETNLYSHNEGAYGSSDAAVSVAGNGDILFAYIPPVGGM